MNIFQTFEIFLREPLSILRERFIQIVGVNSACVSSPNVSVEMMDAKTQITVFNSEKMCNLFQTVLHKRKMNEVKKYIPPSVKGIPLLGLTARR